MVEAQFWNRVAGSRACFVLVREHNLGIIAVFSRRETALFLVSATNNFLPILASLAASSNEVDHRPVERRGTDLGKSLFMRVPLPAAKDHGHGGLGRENEVRCHGAAELRGMRIAGGGNRSGNKRRP